MGKSRIFYHCYDHNQPSGGQKDTYQHVDILNRNGIEAYAFHRQPGFRLSWFENETPTIDEEHLRTIFREDCDFLVLPEDLGIKGEQYPGRKIIFNKSLYYGARAIIAAPDRRDPCRSPSVAAIFSVSKHNRRALQFAYPQKPVYLVRYDIRPQVFRFRPLSTKRPLIACVPKAAAHVAVLHQMLSARTAAGLNRLAEFEWVFLKGLSEAQVASVLQDALIFVFLSVEEGLPRMPLEAMASGCLVTAYRHGPLPEYLPPEFGFCHGDLVSIAARIELLTNKYPNLSDFQGATEAARDISLCYSASEQTESVLAAWESIFKSR